MLTLYEFNALDLNGRAEAAYAGAYLADRRDGECMVQLYGQGDFYIELFYHRQRNEILQVRGFKRLHLLAPYLYSPHLLLGAI